MGSEAACYCYHSEQQIDTFFLVAIFFCTKRHAVFERRAQKVNTPLGQWGILLGSTSVGKILLFELTFLHCARFREFFFVDLEG